MPQEGTTVPLEGTTVGETLTVWEESDGSSTEEDEMPALLLDDYEGLEYVVRSRRRGVVGMAEMKLRSRGDSYATATSMSSLERAAARLEPRGLESPLDSDDREDVARSEAEERASFEPDDSMVRVISPSYLPSEPSSPHAPRTVPYARRRAEALKEDAARARDVSRVVRIQWWFREHRFRRVSAAYLAATTAIAAVAEAMALPPDVAFSIAAFSIVDRPKGLAVLLHDDIDMLSFASELPLHRRREYAARCVRTSLPVLKEGGLFALRVLNDLPDAAHSDRHDRSSTGAFSAMPRLVSARAAL